MSDALLDHDVLSALHEDFASTGDLDDLAALIRNFLERGREGVADAVTAVESGDAEATRQAAHKLKGSSRTLGAKQFGAVAAEVEDADDLVTARRGVRDLEVVFGQTRHALSEWLEGVSDAAS